MDEELYFPCIKDWDTGEISKRVGPAMTWADAVLYLKQNYSGAWERAIAVPKPVSKAISQEAT